MPGKISARAAKTAKPVAQKEMVDELLNTVEEEETPKESTEKKQLTDTQMDYLKRRSVNVIMDSLIESHKGITQVEIFAYKAYKTKSFDKDKLVAEVFKIRPYRGKEAINITTSELWEMFKIRPKIDLTSSVSIRDVKTVKGVADKDYDDMDGILNSFIQISIPAEKVPYEFTDKESGEKKSGHTYYYKISNVYAGKTKERMASWLESFNKLTDEKELYKKYPWNDESDKINSIEVIDLSDSDDDEDE